MAKILKWDCVEKDKWGYSVEEKKCSYIVYRVTKLPDFTSPRFDYLCKETDGRQAGVAKKQMAMIRQFYGLGSNWGVSLRFVKTDIITMYLVFRYSGSDTRTDNQMARDRGIIQNMLMNSEYAFHLVEDSEQLKRSLQVPWANEVVEITKAENEYQGAPYPNGQRQQFYVPYSWTGTDNNMETICSALINHRGQAAVEITILPTSYLSDEREWVNVSISRLRDCMNGETIRGKDNRVLWQGDKLPILKQPLENCEKMNKQYEISRLFLCSIRLFADTNADSLANIFLSSCVKNEGTMQIYRRGFKGFDYLQSCYTNVDVSAYANTPYWIRNQKEAPYRAQRFSRMNSLEEIANFFRMPIPVKPGFPGFTFDTGLESASSKKKERSIIRLGSYLDEAQPDEVSAQFDSQQLAKHGLIVGVPGSGKTTAMFNILYQLWARPVEQKIPFIILEPAKTEYRALKSLDAFKDDMLIFTLGDEGVSPFRFNPMEVLPGIKVESHISKLQACFVGAFDLFDPLPIFLEQAIRRTYKEKGWYDDSRGGDPGVETPTLSDLCRNAEYVVSNSGFDSKMRSDFQASLLERLNSLRRGSKGRMLDTKHSIPMEELMNRPVVLELDSLNGDEKSLMMMFLLSYVYEYCKVKRKSGSPLKHMLLVEEAHNLIGAQGGGSDNRANPKAQTIELFINMLAEMRALGQGILIADQLPTAIAPQAVKQTNVKILMRVTAKDDREEIGNTMDLNEEQMHQVVNFKTGHAYLYHEGEDRVRAIRMLNFKGEHHVEEPPDDEELKAIMADYERTHKELYMPYPQCQINCKSCNRRVRNQAESFVQTILLDNNADPYALLFEKSSKAEVDEYRDKLGVCGVSCLLAGNEMKRILARYKEVGDAFGGCVYIHMLNRAYKQMAQCSSRVKKCSCSEEKWQAYFQKFNELKEGIK